MADDVYDPERWTVEPFDPGDTAAEGGPDDCTGEGDDG